MIGKVDAYITLKKNNTSIEIELDTPNNVQRIKIYTNNEYIPSRKYYFDNTYKQVLKDFGFTDEEIEKMYLLDYTTTVDANDIIADQNTFAIKELYNSLQNSITAKTPISEGDRQASEYIDREEIDFNEYKNLPENVRELYYLKSKSLTFTNQYKLTEDVFNENTGFLLSIIKKFKDSISRIIFDSKLIVWGNKADDIIKITIVPNTKNDFTVTIKEVIDDNIDEAVMEYNIISIDSINPEFKKIFKNFDLSKIMKIQIPKDDVIAYIRQNYLTTVCYSRLKPEVLKQKNELIKKAAKNLYDNILNLTKKEEEILNLNDNIQSNNPNLEYYECYYKDKYISQEGKDYAMQNEPSVLNLSNTLNLIETILL